MAELNEREKNIRAERAEVWNGMESFLEKMDKGEQITTEDRAEFDKREERLSVLDGDLDRVAKMQKREHTRDEMADTRNVSRDENDSEDHAYTQAFRNWFKSGGKIDEIAGEDRQQMLTRAHANPAISDATQIRATADPSGGLQTVPGQGGYLIPQGFWHNLQIALKAYGGLLEHCNIVKTATGNELPWPTSNTTNIVGSYITESNQIGFTDVAFGQGLLYAWTITSGIILASFQLLNDSAFDVDSFLTDRMGEFIGRKVAQELWTGAGSSSKAMTGLMTAVTANGGSGGTSSPAYVQGTAGETVFTLSSPSTAIHALTAGVASWGDLTKMIAGIDVAYRNSGAACAYYMSDSTLQQERQLTDGFGHPLWQPNTQAGQPDTILGYPVIVDNNAGALSTTANTTGAIVFGDLKRAMVVRQVDMAGTMRLNERYADYLSVGYLGYVRMDSQPNDLRAVSVFETAAS